MTVYNKFSFYNFLFVIVDCVDGVFQYSWDLVYKLEDTFN